MLIDYVQVKLRHELLPCLQLCKFCVNNKIEHKNVSFCTYHKLESYPSAATGMIVAGERSSA